ncbi:PREDICTED: transposon Mutator sub-class [Prunus dulcis]|uniref:PREDICTED: transposon Mutator sub-class n=1 Tax=Prunus dulcis TaxID=3755 RepID=A0A5E4GAX6_PRUDU|nr:PREDICTED: transposon Mutator sub-class [Prunus dulcis]
MDSQYSRLWDYYEEVKRANPGTIMKIKCDFNGVYGGQLLTAIGVDANNETWVIAYAVVEVETRDSWTWFLELLAADVGIVNSHGWACISERQKGLLGAFEDVVPNAEHRFCAKNLFSSYIKLYKGKPLKDSHCGCARATTVQQYQKGVGLVWFIMSSWYCCSTVQRCKPIEEYVNSCYSAVTYLGAYDNLIQPINGPNLWGRSEHEAIKPSLYSGQPGRPRKLRRKEPKEKTAKCGKKWLGKQGTAMRCSHCGKEDNNTKTHHRHLPPNQKKKTGEASVSKGKRKGKGKGKGKRKAAKTKNPPTKPIAMRIRRSISTNSIKASTQAS